MNLKRSLFSLSLAAVILGSLGGCAVVPYPAGYYRAQPAYVQTYPAYGYPRANVYYEGGYRGYDNRRYDDHQHYSQPLPSPREVHRDIRRSLGLPRLPGLP